MFVNAIEIASQFTRALHIVTRTYGSQQPVAGAATLFFVNRDGWALTCKHVAAHVAGSEAVATKYSAYAAELAGVKGTSREKQKRKQLAQKYAYSASDTVQVLNRFVNCCDSISSIDMKLHPLVDLALLKFNGYTALGVSQFPVFAKSGNDLKQGKSLCRLGFPFAEFTNYHFDAPSESLSWNNAGTELTPQFPIDGIVTRHVGALGNIVGFEMSTPGLRGQSGGPAFDSSGRVWGMQAATRHLDLDFDVNQEVIRHGQKVRIKESAFLHVGVCVHVDVLKSFMREHSVKFEEA